MPLRDSQETNHVSQCNLISFIAVSKMTVKKKNERKKDWSVLGNSLVVMLLSFENTFLFSNIMISRAGH